jgi:hypothetical protein
VCQAEAMGLEAGPWKGEEGGRREWARALEELRL